MPVRISPALDIESAISSAPSTISSRCSGARELTNSIAVPRSLQSAVNPRLRQPCT